MSGGAGQRVGGGGVRVGWIFSLARSGSSVAAYAAASPWGHAVADEIFGPWDRTVPPYNYPPDQIRLIDLFWNRGERFTPQVIDTTTRLLEQMGAPSGGVVGKHPHTAGDPEQFKRAFPTHGVVFLLRNPLHRLNSLYQRGWLEAIKQNHDVGTYRFFLGRALAHPHRVLYDDLVRRPREFFGSIYRAWGWAHTEADLDAAVAYAKGHYHGSSKNVDPDQSPDERRSEASFMLPPEAVSAYLNDRTVADFMRSVGWSTDPGDYGPTPDDRA